MSKPRTNEYLSILQEKMGDDLKIRSVEFTTEWNSVHYEAVVFSEKELLGEIGVHKKKEYKEEGIGAFMDTDCIVTGDTLDEAIEDFFYKRFEGGQLQ